MLERFRTRSSELERLDTGDYTPAEYERWHKEMRYIHRIFGEFRAIRNTLVAEAAGKEQISVLDVGAGSGELLTGLRKMFGNKELFTVGAEIDAGSAKAMTRRGLSAVVCNALHLPFPDGAFDHSISSLFLHHLSDDDAARVLSEMARVSAGSIFAVDLNRNPIAYYTYKVIGGIFLQRFTLDDGALSILRSRTPGELRKLASMAGLVDVRVRHSRVNRLVLSGTAPK